MINGPEALKSLTDALRDVRREEDEIAKRLARSAERLAKVKESEAELFRDLAEVRLDPSVRADMTGTLTAAERKAQAMLTEHAEAIAAAEKAIGAFDTEIAAKTAERQTETEAIDANQSQLKALSARIAQQVAKDPEFEAARKQAAELQAVAAEAARKTQQAETDREDKGRPYREDPLFMYLWETGYGTRNYKANNLVRWLDGMVARMVDFQEARPNFAMLNDIPLRLKEHADRQAANAEAAEARLDEMETRAIDAAGGQPMRQAIAAAQARMDEIDAALVALEDRRDQAARDLRHLAEGRSPNFETALNELSATLQRQDVASLLADARRTATPRDDAIVSQIDDIRLRVGEEEAETRDLNARLKTLAARRRELEDIQYEFKKSRFDDPRSTFREDGLAGDLLTEFLKGAISAAAYWERWQRSQSWKPGSSDWGGGIGLPRSGRSNPPGGSFNWPSPGSGSSGSIGGSSSNSGSWGRLPGGFGGSSGGGFSRPRTGSRGTRTGGGFKTGGGF